jgi:hypothetical protein
MYNYVRTDHYLYFGTCSDPGDGKPLLLYGYRPAAEVREFNQSPLCGQHFKWKRHVNFYKDGVEYCIGDFVYVTHFQGKIFQIQSLYTPEAEGIGVVPETHARFKTFMDYSIFQGKFGSLSPNAKHGDVVEMEEVIDVPISRVMNKGEVVDPGHRHSRHKSVCVGKYNTLNKSLEPYAPGVYRMTFSQVLNGN